jgi:hypothetical protein
VVLVLVVVAAAAAMLAAVVATTAVARAERGEGPSARSFDARLKRQCHCF